ncbi:hypothetical protein [Leisingera aquaemixtae]|uniref:Uncharacterized protein n=1 Tax=Leisingera aquaemixtae TaxID=1396826 RepID=A0A0P1H9R5_9RHOB|nr:hypothetical protein [Leisingera aquaemixtae]CUH99728.1 hypothetical protein PHA8399_01853 [Leisingera aquaemixtae]
MSEDHNYEFKIEGFKPDTMPFDRLVEYFGKLRAMFSNPAAVHLVGIREGSVANAFAIDQGKESDVLADLRQVQVGSASKSASKAYEEINRMLSEDGAEAVFTDKNGSNIVAFPGGIVEKPLLRTAVGDIEICGNLYHLAGTPNSVKLRVETQEYGKVNADADFKLAIRLRGFLFEDVRLVGKGQWERGPDKAWRLGSLHVTDVHRLQKETLSQALKRLEGVQIDWPDDPIGLMKAVREEGEDNQ